MSRSTSATPPSISFPNIDGDHYGGARTDNPQKVRLKTRNENLSFPDSREWKEPENGHWRVFALNTN